MAKIKISELIIGDWVVLENQPFKVIGINPPYVDLLGNGNRLRLRDIDNDNLSPIPLTPEILEKNGFVKCGRCCTSRTTAYIKDFTFVNHLKERKAWRVKIYGEEGLVELCSILVHHTHQLQHALRLAGVEKEMQL